jgi:rhamnosyltransferase
MNKSIEIPGEKSLTLQMVAAVVVLYYPDDKVYSNISSYIDQVNLVVLVDNSDEPAIQLIEQFSGNKKVVSVVNGRNLGIAAALNIGAREAIARECDLLLTMDQDSSASPGMVEVLKDCFNSYDRHLIAIVSPFHLTNVTEPPLSSSPLFKEMDTVWTSGNLLRLSVYKDVGPFDEALFIDFVDHEYCLRIKRNGYRVLQSNRAILYHNIGNNLRKIDIASAALYVSNHSPLRRYYITRNRFWVTREYSEFRRFCWIDRRKCLAELVTIMLFEKQRVQKIKMIIRGYLDYRSGRMGKFSDEPVQGSIV